MKYIEIQCNYFYYLDVASIFFTQVQRQVTTGAHSHRLQFADDRDLQVEFGDELATLMVSFSLLKLTALQESNQVIIVYRLSVPRMIQWGIVGESLLCRGF